MKNRSYAVGAEVFPGEGIHFRVWAPDHKELFLILEQLEEEPLILPMKAEKEGYFSLLSKETSIGTFYRFRLGKEGKWVADPASRFQPQGPAGPSCVVDPSFAWTDQEWKGSRLEGQIIYEIHIGTFTEAGTFPAAMEQLEELQRLGITLLEMMPINEFPGRFGWGYDGVNLFAPTHLYGTPQEVKAFVNRAHELGIGVILDVVYNHLGPEGNDLPLFAQEYLSEKHTTDWGKAINFDSSSSREFFLENARYWIEEYHFDGLRIDATPWILSSTPLHILAELTQVIKKAGKGKSTLAIGENEPQDTKLLRPYEEEGYGFDALWNDDFHHSAHVRLTGKREAYYTDYLGSPQEFLSALKYGFLYQGQYYDWQKKIRGTPHLKLKASQTINFLENHDQVANSGHGKRLHQLSDPGNFKTLTCLLLLAPNTPLLFQGEEFGSTTPFYYFADHSIQLSQEIKEGRKQSLAQFPRLATEEMIQAMPDPADPMTFTKSKLNFKERESNSQTYTLHKDLIRLRKEDSVFKKMDQIKFDGAILGTDSFLIRYFGEEDGDRLIILNFGPDHYFNPAPEPLLVAGKDLEWEIIWSSESVAYGGEGTPPINIPYWKILGHSAIVLKTCRSAGCN